MDARAGQPGSRDIGSIAHAIREPSFVGPFGLQEISMLVAIIAALTVVSFVVRDLHVVLRVMLTAAAAAVVGTEAYIRVDDDPEPPRLRGLQLARRMGARASEASRRPSAAVAR